MNINNKYSTDETVLYENVVKNRANNELLTADFLYWGPNKGILDDVSFDNDNALNTLNNYSTAKYKVFMFDKSGSILGIDGNTSIIGKDETE